MVQVIRIGEGRVQNHLGDMVRGTVKEAPDALLDADANRLRGATRYERIIKEIRRTKVIGAFSQGN